MNQLLISSADGKTVKKAPAKVDASVAPLDTWCLIVEREEEQTKGGLILPEGTDASIRLVVEKCGPKADESLLSKEVLIHPKAEVLSVEHVTGMRKRFLVRDHSIAAVVSRVSQ